MKLKGEKVEGVYIEEVVIPRPEVNGEAQAHIFKMQAVLDFDDFERMCPMPQPPIKVTPGNPQGVPNPESPDYKKALEEYFTLRTHWAFLKSISATPDLEWETVDMEDPKTWANYLVEFKNSGFSQYEVHRLMRGYATANCLDEKKLEDARQYFLAGKHNGQGV